MSDIKAELLENCINLFDWQWLIVFGGWHPCFTATPRHVGGLNILDGAFLAARGLVEEFLESGLGLL